MYIHIFCIYWCIHMHTEEGVTSTAGAFVYILHIRIYICMYNRHIHKYIHMCILIHFDIDTFLHVCRGGRVRWLRRQACVWLLLERISTCMYNRHIDMYVCFCILIYIYTHTYVCRGGCLRRLQGLVFSYFTNIYTHVCMTDI